MKLNLAIHHQRFSFQQLWTLQWIMHWMCVLEAFAEQEATCSADLNWTSFNHIGKLWEHSLYCVLQEKQWDIPNKGKQNFDRIQSRRMSFISVFQTNSIFSSLILLTKGWVTVLSLFSGKYRKLRKDTLFSFKLSLLLFEAICFRTVFPVEQ